MDFTIEDKIRFSGNTGIFDAQAALATAKQVGADTVLYVTGSTLTLRGFSTAALTANNFLFSTTQLNVSSQNGISYVNSDEAMSDCAWAYKSGAFTVDCVTGLHARGKGDRIIFPDGVFGFDANGKLGFVYRLYQAAFNRTPDTDGLSNNLHLLEIGTVTNRTLTDAFIGSAEFQNTYGSLSNTQFVTLLYKNVLHRQPDAGGLAGWVDYLDTGKLSRADVLIGFSESTENHNNVDAKILQGVPLNPSYMFAN
jgi:hypothetical protein